MDTKGISFDRCLALATGFLVLTFLVYASSFLINDEMDWRILLALNPDSYIPVIEETMIFVSDFSMVLLGLIFLFWEIAYQASGNSQQSRLMAVKTLNVTGLIFACVAATGIFWDRYEHSIIFLPLSLFVFAGFRFIGSTLVRYDEKKLRKIDSLFWITLLSALLVEISVECIIKGAVGRPRPLSDAYTAYHWGIRRVADEVVKNGNSYVAGHSAILFGMITPMLFFISKNKIKICLLMWALLHSFSRVFLAAHFPFCSLMGSALGFLMGSLVINMFWPAIKE